MNFQQPLSQQVSKIQVPEAITQTLSAVQGNVSQSLNEFSSKAAGVSSEFINSNGLVARIAFILLVLVCFIVLFRLGVLAVAYFLGKPRNPYIVKGLITGNTSASFSPDDTGTNPVTIQRSNNQSTGMEFTWSVWLNITNAPAPGVYQHVFHKGSADLTTDKTQSPGLYIYRPSTASTASTDNIHLRVNMSSYDPSTPLYTVDLDNIPLKKWIHVAIRLENTLMDVYVNGTLAQRVIFQNTLPRQNYGSVYVCQPVSNSSAGFGGFLSNLRYYDHALNVFSITNIVASGPNLTPSTLGGGANSNKASNFFSNSWYSNRY
jgi:hypothetical protein